MKAINRYLLCASYICIINLLYASFLSARTTAAKQEPDNAALLYYQAFLTCPDYDDVPLYLRNRSGADIADLRKYTGDYQHVIKLLEAADKLPYCNMAIPWLQREIGGKVDDSFFKPIRVASMLIGANVRILAANGDYRTALSQCFMMRRIPWRIAENRSLLFIRPLNVTSMNRASFLNLRAVLEVMPPDEKTLRWLKEQLAEAPRMSEVHIERLKQFLDIWLRYDSPKAISELRRKLLANSINETQKHKVMALTDGDLLSRIRKPFEEFHHGVIYTLNSDMSYEQKHARLENLEKEYMDQAENNPAIILSLQLYTHEIPITFNMTVRDTRWCNAYEVAAEIYLVKATTGRLPEKIPDGVPKDPLTDQNFLYKTTGDGFVLSSPPRFKNWSEFKFKVPGG
jgi:hypothetical protein